MEEILILLLQVIGQILFEIFAYMPWDWFWYSTPYDRRETDSDGTWIAVLASILVGAFFGWLSLFVFPDVLVKWGWLRIVLLFASPIGSGLVSRETARWRQQRNAFIEPATHFWIGLCFSIGLVWVRFAFAHRG
jgi:hypothetical protein